jgi:hypothetical protein
MQDRGIFPPMVNLGLPLPYDTSSPSHSRLITLLQVASSKTGAFPRQILDSGLPLLYDRFEAFCWPDEHFVAGRKKKKPGHFPASF